MRIVVISVALLLAIASGAYWWWDDSRRVDGERFVREFTIAERRPVTSEDAVNTQTFDAMNWVLADAALQDAIGSVDFNSLDDEERQRWLAAVLRYDEELDAAQELALDSLTARPGWAFHMATLGQLAFVRQERRIDTSGDERRWLTPLAYSASRAPGNDTVSNFLGGALLDRWGSLPPDVRAAAPARIRRAFLSPSFTSRGFLPATSILGTAATLELVPDDVVALESALGVAIRQKSQELARAIYPRWERAERADRAADLALLEERLERRDVDRLRALAPQWLREHPPASMGDEGARKELARVLEIHPFTPGVWPGDPRSEGIRVLMERPVSREVGQMLLDTASSLTNVPETLVATLNVAAGNLREGETMWRQSATMGSLEWTRFLVALANGYLSEGNDAAAAEAYRAISSAAREECEVLLLRREMAKTSPVSGSLQELATALGRSVATSFPEEWFRNGRLSLCADPEQFRGKSLTVSLTSDAPAMIEWGWNDVRYGTVFAPSGVSAFLVPLGGVEGRETFWVRDRMGGAVVATADVR